MKPTTRRTLICSLLAAALGAGVPAGVAPAGKRKGRRSKDDHDNVWSASRSGAILPLPRVLEMVAPNIDGEIIETEFDYEDGRPVYEFKYVDKRGRVRELYVDARTGAIVKDEPD